MRIALFTDTFLPQVNGVARTLARWLDHALEAGHEVALITPAAGARCESAHLHIELPGLPLPFYPQLKLAVPLDPWSARRLVAFAPEIVHVATEFTVGRSGLAWAAAHSTPLVTSFHTDFPAYLAGYGVRGLERVAWRYLRSFHATASVTFCPSTWTRAQLEQNGFHPRLRVWSRGVDTRLYRPQRRTGEMRERIAPGARCIALYVGRLAPEKRVHVLLDAFRSVCDRMEDVRLVIVGDGPSAADLRREANENVTFTGFLTGDALADVYAAADIFTFPSDTETFGNVVLEAMASGLPVIGAARGGVRDIIQAGENGVLVPPCDAGAFADAMVTLLADDALRARLSAGARTRALRSSWTAALDPVFDAYRALAPAAAVRVA